MQKFKSVILPLVFSVLIALAATQPVVSPAKIMSTSNTPVAMFETKSAQETAELWVDVELGDYGTNNYYFTGFWGKTYRVGQIFWRWSIDVIPEDIPDFDLFAVYVYVDFVPGEALEDNGDIWVSGDVTINLLNDY